MILLKQILLTGSLVLAVAQVSGCKSESAPKAPKKDTSLDAKDKKGLDEEGEAEAGAAEAGEEGGLEGAEPEAERGGESLSLEVSDASALKVKIGTPVSITFNVKGAGSKDILVGMMASPSGATVEVSGSSVTYKWQTPTGGTYPLKFLLRDKAKCEDKKSASACKVNGSETSLKAESYDVASEEFSLEVETDDSLGLPGNVAGNGGNGGGAGGGNGQLIQQITALLGGGGGGNIQDALKGLSGGQLQGILEKLQNGGGGGGFGQLIGLLGG